MNLEGRIIRLRAVEPADTEILYAWENDTSVWSVSGTTEPFSRAQMEAFVAAQQQGDLFRTGQLRLIAETRSDARAVGAVDLFEFDPLNRRAGIGILIYRAADRGRGLRPMHSIFFAATPARGSICTSSGAMSGRTTKQASGSFAVPASGRSVSNGNGS